MELALEAGADDVVSDDDGYQVLTAPEMLNPVREAIEQAKIPIISAEVAKIPENTVRVSRACGGAGAQADGRA